MGSGVFGQMKERSRLSGMTKIAELPIPRTISKLFDDQFEKGLIVSRPCVSGDCQPGRDHFSDPLSALLANRWSNVESAAKKSFYQVRFLKGQLRCLRV